MPTYSMLVNTDDLKSIDETLADLKKEREKTQIRIDVEQNLLKSASVERKLDTLYRIAGVAKKETWQRNASDVVVHAALSSIAAAAHNGVVRL